MKFSKDNVEAALMLAAAAVAVYLVMRVKDGLSDLSLPDVINPLSDQNLAYQAGNGVLHAVAPSSRDDSIGTYIYGLLNDDPFANDATVVGSDAYNKARQATAPATSSAWSWDSLSKNWGW